MNVMEADYEFLSVVLKMWTRLMMGFDVEHVGPATRELVVCVLEVKESSHL
jgi:hypothetical protein